MSRLDPDECFHIARVAYANDKYQLACLWLRESYQLLRRGVKALVSTRDIELLFASSAILLGDYDTAIDITEGLVEKGTALMEIISTKLAGGENWVGGQHQTL